MIAASEITENAAVPRQGDCPPVLIITPNVLSTTLGGGVTLNKLFAGWPGERIAQIHADVIEPDRTVCQRFYSVNGPLYSHLFPHQSRQLGRFAAWLTGTGEHGIFWSRLTPRLRRWLDKVPPRVVFSQTGNLAFLRLTRQIVGYTGASLVLHASDDWVTDWPATAIQPRLPLISDHWSRVVQREYGDLVRRASVRLAISDKMAAEYRGRYGGEWQCFYNPIEPALWPARASLAPTFTTARPFRLLYSGSLLSTSQLDGLRDAALAVADLASEGFPVELQIATHRVYFQHRASFELSRAVRFVDLVPQAELPSRLADVDLLLLPSAFDDASRKFIRLSIPGKTAEYMISGTPVMVYGPANAAVVEDAQAKDWAYVVPGRGINHVKAAIRRLAGDVALRQQLAARAREVALRDYDINRLRPAFQRLICEAGQRDLPHG